MARSKKEDDDLIYRPKGSYRFNVKYKTGALDGHVTAAYLKDCKTAEIEWIWIVEAKRKATPEEIKQLCAGTWTRV